MITREHKDEILRQVGRITRAVNALNDVCSEYEDEEVNEIIADNFPLAWDLMTSAFECRKWLENVERAVQDVESTLNAMNDTEILRIWNKIHGEDDDKHVYKVSDIDKLFKDVNPVEMLQHFEGGDFSVFDEYFYDDEAYGAISFDKIRGEHSPVSIEDIVTYIKNNGWEAIE